MDKLINEGFITPHGLPPAGPKTVIVLGVARSGTSMAAAVLEASGVPMGKQRDKVVFEDVEFARSMEEKDLATFRELVQSRNEEFPIWGFKRPQAFQYLDKFLSHFRNPCLIVMFRDILAIAIRNSIAMEIEADSNLEHTLQQYGQLLKFLKRQTTPALYVSYEKALLDSPAFCRRVHEFLGLEPTESLQKSALSKIQINRKEYLQGARKNRGLVGNLGPINRGCLRGWARNDNSDQPVVLEFAVNDGHRIEIVADEYREDLAKRGLGSGRFGFAIPVSKLSQRATFTIIATEKETGVELPGSPKTYCVVHPRDRKPPADSTGSN